MAPDAIIAELREIEGILLDERLSDVDRFALYGAAQALRHVLDAATWSHRHPRHSLVPVTKQTSDIPHLI